MRSSAVQSSPVRLILLFAVMWLFLISLLHYGLNIYEGNRPTVTMGYMPVISNLAAPLLDAASKELDSGVRYKALKFSSFAEMAEALRHDQIDAAFIIAPLSVVLRQQGVDVKVVYIGNRHESSLVVRKELQATSLADLRGRTIAVPMRYSGHNIFLRHLLRDANLTDEIKIVELNPPDMAAALASGALDGYFVGEPFAAQSVRSGVGELLFRVEEKHPSFICNLLLVKASLIDQDPDMVEALVQSAVRSGFWAHDHQREAAVIAATYWSQPADLIYYAMTTPPDRIDFDKYIPTYADMDHMVKQMVRYGLTDSDDLGSLVEDKFSRQVVVNMDIHNLIDILSPASK